MDGKIVFGMAVQYCGSFECTTPT